MMPGKLTGGKRLSVSELITSALFTALIAVMAQIAIPVPFSPVPLTGQVVGVLLAGALLGSKGGLLSITAYLLLGAAGAPVFSLGRGGLFMLIGPSGGYLLGFLPAVYFAGIILEKHKRPGSYLIAVTLLGALAIIYLCGTMQLSLIMQYTLLQSLLIGVVPFILPDLIKIALATWLSVRIRSSLNYSSTRPHS